MITSMDGVDLLRSFEGLKLTAYKDSSGIWTIGIGHTGPDVVQGLTITEDQAYSLLHKDLMSAERCVNSRVMGSLEQHQFNALVSWTFNLGCGTLGDLLPLLNTGKYDEAAEKMMHYNKTGGVVVKGLQKRRAVEAGVFLGYVSSLKMACPECAQQPWEPCLGTASLYSAVPHAKRVEAGQVSTPGKPITDEVIERTGLI